MNRITGLDMDFQGMSRLKYITTVIAAYALIGAAAILVILAFIGAILQTNVFLGAVIDTGSDWLNYLALAAIDILLLSIFYISLRFFVLGLPTLSAGGKPCAEDDFQSGTRTATLSQDNHEKH